MSENPGGLVVKGGDNVPPVEIGLNHLPKTGVASVPPPAPTLATALHLYKKSDTNYQLTDLFWFLDINI